MIQFNRRSDIAGVCKGLNGLSNTSIDHGLHIQARFLRRKKSQGNSKGAIYRTKTPDFIIIMLIQLIGERR